MNCPTCCQKLPPTEEFLVSDYAVHWRGKSMEVTRAESKILQLLNFETRVLNRDLHMMIYGAAERDHNAVAVHICRLRERLPSIGLTIDSKKSHGYILAEYKS
jgi:DNA-binding response OmpR family regulator